MNAGILTLNPDFERTADFDPGISTFNLTSAGSMDAFVHKLANTTIGIAENNFPYPFKYYPNPTRGEFTIDMGTEIFDGTIVIRNISGQEIIRQHFISPTSLTLNLQGEEGVYFVELKSGNKRAVFRIVSNR